MKKKDQLTEEEKCVCGHENCDCGCQEGKECTCGDECHCGDECNCGDECHCGDDLNKKLADQYLNLARQIQADFDNYRKRTTEQMNQVRTDGMVQAISVFLPVVDILEKAIKMISDEKALEGLKMVLKGIENSMQQLGVERLHLKGEQYSPETAQAIASLNDNSMEDGIVIEEVTSGYKLNNKIIRYAQVVVNKIEN